MSERRLTLRETCGACPEAYDVYDGDTCVGYLRLRHGYFRADCHGETVYEGHPKGDGIFESGERAYFLNAACRAILAELKRREREGVEPIYDIGPPARD